MLKCFLLIKFKEYTQNRPIKLIRRNHPTLCFWARREEIGRCHSQIFWNIGVLTNFSIFTGKYLCWSLFLIKLEASWRPVTFKCEHCKVCISSGFIEHLWWLLLKIRAQNRKASFYYFFKQVTFSTYESVCLEFLWTITSETMLKLSQAWA